MVKPDPPNAVISPSRTGPKWISECNSNLPTPSPLPLGCHLSGQERNKFLAKLVQKGEATYMQKLIVSRGEVCLGA